MTRCKAEQRMRVLDRELHDDLTERLAREEIHERRTASEDEGGQQTDPKIAARVEVAPRSEPPSPKMVTVITEYLL